MAGQQSLGDLGGSRRGSVRLGSASFCDPEGMLRSPSTITGARAQNREL
jgi:hypothetical protein